MLLCPQKVLHAMRGRTFQHHHAIIMPVRLQAGRHLSLLPHCCVSCCAVARLAPRAQQPPLYDPGFGCGHPAVADDGVLHCPAVRCCLHNSGGVDSS